MIIIDRRAFWATLLSKFFSYPFSSNNVIYGDSVPVCVMTRTYFVFQVATVNVLLVPLVIFSLLTYIFPASLENFNVIDPDTSIGVGFKYE